MAAAGNALSPFIISPFLVDIPDFGNLNGALALNGTSALHHNLTSGINTSLENGMHLVLAVDHGDVERVRYAYLLIGSLCCITGLMFGVLLIINGCTFKKLETLLSKSKAKENGRVKNRKPFFNAFFLISLVLFHFLYVFIEPIPASYLALFLVSGLGWTVKNGALATTVLWGFLAGSRVINIPISLRLRPDIIISINLILVLLASTCLMFVAEYGQIFVLACLAVMGLGLGPIFAAHIVWASRFIHFAGFASGLCMVANSIARMGGYYFTGYLMETYTYMCLIYVVVGGSVAIVTLYFGSLLLAKMCGPHSEEQLVETNEAISLHKVTLSMVNLDI